MTGLSIYSKGVNNNKFLRLTVTAKPKDVRLIYKSQFLCTSNEEIKFEFKNTIPFTLASKNEILRYKYSNTYKLYLKTLQNSD